MGFIITPDDEVLVIECNVRASRSLPFMSKTLRRDMIGTMSRVLMGHDMSHIKPEDDSHIDYVGVKVPQFSWTRLKGADPRCGVEMASTGEVATFGVTPEEAFLKSVNSTHIKFPKKTILCSAMQEDHVEGMVDLCRECVSMGYEVIVTEKLGDALANQKIACRIVTTKDARDILMQKQADFLISIPSRKTRDQAYEAGEHYQLRRSSVDYSIPVFTELENARMLVRALQQTESFSMHSYDELPNVSMLEIQTLIVQSEA